MASRATTRRSAAPAAPAATSAACYTGATPAPAAIVLAAPSHTPGFVFVSGREAPDRWSATQIFLATSSPNHPTNLTNNARWNSSPAISPDGTRMAFISDRSLRVLQLAD